MLRACGVSIRKDELSALLKKTGVRLKCRTGHPRSPDAINFSDFEKMYAYQQAKDISRKDFLEALATFDKNGDMSVSQAEIEHVMTNCGEKVSKRVFDDFMRTADVDSKGNFKYKAFVDAFYDESTSE